MMEFLQWIGAGFRAVVGTMILLVPGVVFWLVVVGITATIQRSNLTVLYQIIQNRIRRSLKAVAQKIAATVSAK